MKNRIKPEKRKGHRIKGRIIESTKNELKFIIDGGSKELKEEIKYRVQKVEKTKDNVFEKPYFDYLPIYLSYLNRESLKGLYKEPKMNLPYEIFDGANKKIYQQDARNRTKKNIFDELEKAAIDEGLRN